MKKILVTGGAGYIGSFMIKRLLEDGFEVLVIDSLENGHKEVIDKRAKFFKADLLDKEIIKNIFANNNFEAIIHFAGFISMKESMEDPGKYFKNNIFASLNLLEEMQNTGIKNFIFSSTAGIYGNPIKIPISEDHPKNPTNPYGESKLAVEKILTWYKEIYKINFVSLRYFNAAGGALDGSMGENHDPETHIIPNAINAILSNLEFMLYGDDYNTPDKTCVRDYIHVVDLVEAHILALKKLQNDKGGYFYNVGTGYGYSNNQVISMVRKISNIDFKVTIKERRVGDADILVADAKKINKELGFSPKYSDLNTIIKTAWEWHKKLKIKNEKQKTG